MSYTVDGTFHDFGHSVGCVAGKRLNINQINIDLVLIMAQGQCFYC